MSTIHLDRFFTPKSVALVGASSKPASVGDMVARNLLSDGFKGEVFLVNRHRTPVRGLDTYGDVSELPRAPDLAVVCVPAAGVPEVIDKLGRMGTKAAVVLSAGFSEGGNEAGKRLQEAMLQAARPHQLRILGPNCIGMMAPECHLNATFTHMAALPGSLAFVAQSGAILSAVVDWANPRNIGFSCMVSMGGMADVDFGDLLDHLAMDRKTSAILLYVEGITHARKFMSAARAASRTKPVVVIKGGRFAAGAKAASSHTGALAGSATIYQAAFQRAGMLQVDSLTELFDAVEILGRTTHLSGPRLAIMTNGGGIGVLATDALIARGGALTNLSAETLSKLDAILPPMWSKGNPIDILGDAHPTTYTKVLDILLSAPEVDAISVHNCPVAVSSSADAAQAVLDTPQLNRRLVLTNWVGETTAEQARDLLSTHGLPSYETPDQAMRAFMYLVQYQESRRTLMETPPSIPETFQPDTDQARTIIHQALDDGRDWLNEVEAKALLRCYRIPTVATLIAKSPEEAGEMAARGPGPYALKILSPDIIHKSDVGGVALNLQSPQAVTEAAHAMLERLQHSHPTARLRGFTVEPMVLMAGGVELILGMTTDAVFGPVLLFGQGGIAVEVLSDTAFALPPLNMHLAQQLMSRTRVNKLLAGFRDQPPCDRDAIALTLIKLSQLVSDLAEVAECDINPLLASPRGVMALDARFKIGLARVEKPEDRLAIRPYPKALEQPIALPNGETMLLRPILPEDEPAIQRSFAALSQRNRFLRFFSPLRELPHTLAARLTQIDYDREMALVVAEPNKPAGEAEILGGARIMGEPNMERAEYAITVREDQSGKGLGTLLMNRIIDYARSRGFKVIYGEVLSENTAMTQVCRKLGFRFSRSADDPSIIHVELDLANPLPASSS